MPKRYLLQGPSKISPYTSLLKDQGSRSKKRQKDCKSQSLWMTPRKSVFQTKQAWCTYEVRDWDSLYKIYTSSIWTQSQKEEEKGTQRPRLAKKPFIINLCQEREKWVLIIKWNWVYQPHSRTRSYSVVVEVCVCTLIKCIDILKIKDSNSLSAHTDVPAVQHANL